MLKGKKAVIFDMDGSLVDSMWIWPEVDRIYMTKYHLSPPETFHKDIEGRSYTETAQYFVDTFSTLDRTVEQVMKEWRDMTIRLYATKVFPKPGAVEFLESMRRAGVKLGIATSNNREIAEAALNARNLAGFFDSVRTSCEVAAGMCQTGSWREKTRAWKYVPWTMPFPGRTKKKRKGWLIILFMIIMKSETILMKDAGDINSWNRHFCP